MENKQGKQKPYEARKQWGESLAKTSTHRVISDSWSRDKRQGRGMGQKGRRKGDQGREMELEKNEK